MRFVLEFTDFEEKHPATCFWFEISPPFKCGLIEWNDWEEYQLDEQTSKLESEYGVHNYYGTQTFDGDNLAEFGYHSYEVKQDKWEELVNKWRDWFVTQNFNPGEVQTFLAEEYVFNSFSYRQNEEGNF